mgnify:CR=1 FL=1
MRRIDWDIEFTNMDGEVYLVTVKDVYEIKGHKDMIEFVKSESKKRQGT